MSKSLLYAANTAVQEVPADGVVNFGQVVRRFGCNCKLSGGNVTIDGSGYYTAIVNLTVVPDAGGTFSVQVFKDGTAVPGASAVLSVAANTTYQLSFPCPVRQMCCCESTLVVVVSADTTVSNAAIEIVKE